MEIWGRLSLELSRFELLFLGTGFQFFWMNSVLLEKSEQFKIRTCIEVGKKTLCARASVAAAINLEKERNLDLFGLKKKKRCAQGAGQQQE